ncbi:sugar-binding transcriptional regulator [Litorilinea aerophila]|uniref:Sugar-binding transcriptional regulator n=1 Tax=Litorilinea aerophila TaxID=1204385 RepID=A0A540VGK2_9CHLR|nr:sugar-binding transcriptional regulator [Litorilinea aerophila]MCC9076570.1 sugar-binding transcriptional regulator [Litorilinea aerophila]GIV79971.1 MAG: DNA-binding transcriptional regulator [Litorilinea sp.]
MATIDELRLMTKVARLYYENNRRQSEIAAQLDISQATVSRLLKRAHEEQIVRIRISPPPGIYSELEAALQERYDLKDVIVVDCEAEDDEQEIIRNLGVAAAFYLETTLKRGEVVGISSWSETLLAMVDAMHPLAQPLESQVVQILGGIGNPAAEVHANHLTTKLANLVGSEPKFLAAPGVVGSPEARAVICNDTFVQETLKLFDRINVALVGIGALLPSKLLASSGNVFSQAEIDLLKEEGAVGDICLRFYNSQGVPVVTPLNERVIGITLEQLRKVERCVGIAGGRRKWMAIRGALEGELINVLITDHFTAQRLIDGRLFTFPWEPSMSDRTPRE